MQSFRQFRQDGKGSRISATSNDRENCLMMSNVRDGDDASKFLMLLRDLVLEYHRAKFGSDWTTNNGETGEGHNMSPPAYIVPKYPSLNRVKI